MTHMEHMHTWHKLQRPALGIVSTHKLTVPLACTTSAVCRLFEKSHPQNSVTKVLSPACFSGESSPENLGRSGCVLVCVSVLQQSRD